MRKILFVGIENSTRSQMAEAFARMHGEGVLEAHSAGSAPADVVNPGAIQAMEEVGFDLTDHRSKSLDEVPLGPWDRVITMGCSEECPWVPAARRDNWALPDPKTMGAEALGRLRDQIERRVKELVADCRPPFQFDPPLRRTSRESTPAH